MKKELKNYTLNQMKDLIKSIGEPEYRAKQIFEWVYKGIKTYDEMKNVPKVLIKKLQNEYIINSVSLYKRFDSKVDKTKKYLFSLQDENIVETVLMKYKHGNSICISTQVGCKMGCKFCASTIGGLVRNLTCGEMVDQVLSVQNDIGERISNIVLMGIGEPLDNYDNVMQFLKVIHDESGLNIGYRHITISTCGIVDKIDKLSKENLQVNLSVSLHGPNNKIREQLMPVNRLYNIELIIEACKRYIKATNRRITFEYSLVDGINDSRECAKELSKLLKGMLCHVNLIPVNKIEERNYNESLRKNVEAFKIELERNRIPTTIRRRLGYDISASCGQLKKKVIDNTL